MPSPGAATTIGRLLVDIHGQSEHLSLLDNRSHLVFLDSYAHTRDMRNDFSIKVIELRKIERELEELSKMNRIGIRREEFLRFQLDEIAQAKLRDGEEEELEGERNILASTEKLKTFSYEVYRALYEDDTTHRQTPALDRLNEAVQALKKLVALDPNLAQQLKFLEETTYGITETARDIRAYSDRLHYDPNRLEEIESRLEMLRSLKRKYGQTIADILAYRVKAEEDLEKVCHYAERRTGLDKARNALKEELGLMASRLSQKRFQAAKKLMADVEQELSDLNMSQVQFGVSINQQPDGEGIPFHDGKSYAFSEDGADTVEFMAATNPGEPIKPLARIASTGKSPVSP